MLFEPYARDLVRRLPSPIPGRVLELACGTGILTRRPPTRSPATRRWSRPISRDAMVAHARERLARRA